MINTEWAEDVIMQSCYSGVYETFAGEGRGVALLTVQIPAAL